MVDASIAVLKDIETKWQEPGLDMSDRKRVAEAARALVASLETPGENIMRLTYQWPVMLAAARVCASLDIYNQLAGDDSPKSATELAEASGAEPRLVERLVRHLVNGNIVDEDGPGIFKANGVTRLCATPEAAGVIVHMHDGTGMVLPRLDEALRKTGYRTSVDDKSSLFRLSTGIDTDYFTWLNRPGNEDHLDTFQKTMEFTAYGIKWFKTVPLDEILGAKDEVAPDAPLIVDVGGGYGREMAAFHEAHPERKGRLILQDLGPTIQRVNAAAISPVEATVHDFFTPQHVKGAKAYLLKRILHDWDDEKCLAILCNLREAMTPGYSKILVNDIVISDVGADWFSTGIDIMMMVALSAQERKEQEWKDLVGKAGLRVFKFWDTDDADGKLIEIVAA